MNSLRGDNFTVVDSKDLTRYLLTDIADFAGLPAYFVRHIRICRVSGCWNWAGWLSSNLYYPKHKYGYCKYVDQHGKRRSMSAHRFVYTRKRGPIPEHLDVDHLCRNKLCVNPEHLEAVTHRENAARVPAELRRRHV